MCSFFYSFYTDSVLLIACDMVYLYNFGIAFYFTLIKLVSFMFMKARFLAKGLGDTRNKLTQLQNIGTNGKVVWMHVSSLGEFEQGRPLIEAIRKDFPGHKIVITFFSPSGYEIRKNYNQADLVLYLLPDTKANAIFFLDKIKPSVAIFIKYEFWFHYLKELNKRNIPTYLVSGIFRENQVFFSFYGSWYKSWLKLFNHLFVQNASSYKLLTKQGITNCSVAPDTRFDRVYSIAQSSMKIPVAEAFSKDSFVIVAGSTWPADEKLLIWEVNNNKHNTKYIIAPHQIDAAHIQAIIAKLKVPFIKFSEATAENVSDKRVLIIDNIGMLSALYKYGKVAYIGGGFGKGIHNTLEAAVYGVPVLFGPKYQKFQEALDLVSLGGARVIQSQENYNKTIELLNSNTEAIKLAGDISGNYVKNNIGGTEIVCKALPL